MTTNFVSPIELNQQLNKSLMLSSRQIGWKGILVEQYQNPATPSETELPALSDHWLNLPLGHPVHLTQKRDERLHESIVQKGDSIFVPAGQPSYWRCQGSATYCPTVHIHLKPELITQVAEASEFDRKQINLVNCFSKQDLHLQHVAMLLLAELKSGGMMGQLYVESLTQVLVIHLLRHYSSFTQTITSQNRSLTHAQLQRAIDYIHTHLDRDLSLVEIARVINISPTYFASLFKRATGISPHQYVIKQRVDQAKLLLLTTDLAIADIALQVGFSSQSHLTQHFKRLTRMTPKQVR
ncbi:helix-turn-helix transcriptional regulator [Brasilonema sp. CT11]|nr:helix-turn-helix transcriptional regulator [Brasilonema sp. CT11]